MRMLRRTTPAIAPTRTALALTGAAALALSLVAGSPATAKPEGGYKKAYAQAFDTTKDSQNQDGKTVDNAPRADVVKSTFIFYPKSATLSVGVKVRSTTETSYEENNNVTQYGYAFIYAADTVLDDNPGPEVRPLVTFTGAPGDGTGVRYKINDGQFVPCDGATVKRDEKVIRFNIPASCMNGVEQFVGRSSAQMLYDGGASIRDYSRTTTKKLSIVKKS